MCLHVRTDIHGKNNGPKTAQVPLLVWKALERGNSMDHGFSPFQYTKWTFGVMKKALMDVRKSGINSVLVERGLHAHVLSEEQRKDPKLVKRYTTGNNCLWGVYNGLYPAVIPAGAQFYIGTKADIVTNKMTVYRDMDHLMSSLGINNLAPGITRDTVRKW